MELVRTMDGHFGRVGVLTWNDKLLSSGSRDKKILHRDVKSSSNYIAKLIGHSQEICGLKWSPDNQQLASGGNDNKLMLWSSSNSYTPI